MVARLLQTLNRLARAWRTRACFLLAMGSMLAGVRAANPRELLVQALTTNDVGAQISLVERLTDADDPIIGKALAAWRQGGAFVYQPDDKPKVPFILDAASDSAGKAHGIEIATGQLIKDATGQPMLFQV